MVVLLNGSFGVGKTTVARLLRSSWAGSVVYDPEWCGLALMRLPRSVTGWRADDFQDMALWRKSVISGARLFRCFSQTVIVPMTISRRDYFKEVTNGIRRFEPCLKLFCLRASLETIKGRITARGDDPDESWLSRRLAECEEAFRQGDWGARIDTQRLSARQVAEVVEQLRHE